MIKYEEAHVAIERHEGERPREVVIDNATVPIGERSEAENVSNGDIVIVKDNVRSLVSGQTKPGLSGISANMGTGGKICATDPVGTALVPPWGTSLGLVLWISCWGRFM